MAKFKVYELAKELNRPGKEVLVFLQERGIEVKAVQSSVDDAAADMVKKHFGGQTGIEQYTGETELNDKILHALHFFVLQKLLLPGQNTQKNGHKNRRNNLRHSEKFIHI